MFRKGVYLKMKQYKITNMHCEGCLNRLKNGLKEFKLEYDISLESKILKLNCSKEVLVKVLEKLDALEFSYEEIN